MGSQELIAHISEDGRLHILSEHLLQTAKRASVLASTFGYADWGYLAALWHDIGKYSQDFQNMIQAKNGLDAHIEPKSRVDHSTAGAINAIEQGKASYGNNDYSYYLTNKK